MRQAPCSRDKRKMELVVVTLPERDPLKFVPWALIGHWYWKEKETTLINNVQFKSWVVLAYLLVPGLNYILYRYVHTFFLEAYLQLEWCLRLTFFFFRPAHGLMLRNESRKWVSVWILCSVFPGLLDWCQWHINPIGYVSSHSPLLAEKETWFVVFAQVRQVI